MTRWPGLPRPNPKGGTHEKYVCVVCNYVYDPKLGMPEDGIAPGTVFADIPADWSCPDCGVSKDDFEPLVEG